LSSLEAIRSLEAADFALSEIGRLQAIEKQIQAECDRELGLVRGKHKERMVVVVDGERMTLADRRTQIEAALEKFATKSRAEILEGGLKSKALNHGTVGWRSSARKLVACEGGAPKTLGIVLDTIVDILRKTIGGLKLLFDAGDGRFLDVQITFKKDAMLDAFERKEITKAELRKVGLRVQEPVDTFYVKAKALEVSSQSASPPA
jgi:hypothetical protein